MFDDSTQVNLRGAWGRRYKSQGKRAAARKRPIGLHLQRNEGARALVDLNQLINSSPKDALLLVTRGTVLAATKQYIAHASAKKRIEQLGKSIPCGSSGREGACGTRL